MTDYKVNYYPEEIVEALCELADVHYADKQKMQCVDAVNYLMMSAQNPMNSDFFRTFYNVLQDVAHKYDK